MKYLIPLIIIITIIGGIYYYQTNQNSPNVNPTQNSNEGIIQNPDAPETQVIAEGLDTPWALVFLPDKSLLVTERQGTVRKVSAQGGLESNPVITIANVLEIGEGGLLGMTLHPEFETNNYIYFYYTYRSDGNNTLNRVVRMAYRDNKFSDEELIIDAIPGASNHNGGRIAFGPDNFLYVTTGDAQEPSQSQDTNSLAGKILRVTDKGEAAPGNPFNNRVYSFGHRNPQGLTWDADGNLWSTEHGRSGFPSGLDEVNLIQSGKNYGWPDSQGEEVQNNTIGPIIHSGNSTWAPGSATIYQNSLFFGGLRGASLYEGDINNNSISSIQNHYENEYGRIREVITGPDDMIYITTSNKDGRGNPESNDDRVIKINPTKL